MTDKELQLRHDLEMLEAKVEDTVKSFVEKKQAYLDAYDDILMLQDKIVILKQKISNL